MNQLNKEYLDKNRGVYDEIIRAQTAKKASLIKYELLRILQEEFLPGYVLGGDCGSCLFDMVKLLYQLYDKWLEAQPKEEPITVHATFPKHDNNAKDTIGIPNIESNPSNGVNPSKRHFRRRK